MYTTLAYKKFTLEHAEEGATGLVCKETGQPIMQVAAQHITGTPAFEPGDAGTRVVTVLHLWCPVHGKQPEVRSGSHIAESDLVRLY